MQLRSTIETQTFVVNKRAVPIASTSSAVYSTRKNALRNIIYPHVEVTRQAKDSNKAKEGEKDGQKEAGQTSAMAAFVTRRS